MFSVARKCNKRFVAVFWGVMLVLMSLLSMQVCNERVFAETSRVNPHNSLAEKAILQGVYNCYSGDHVKSFIDVRGYQNMGSLVDSNKDRDGNFVVLWSGSEGTGILDNGTYDSYYSVADDGLSCRQLFVGVPGDARGVLEVMGFSEPAANTSAVTEFLDEMGYRIEGLSVADSDKDCFTADYVATRVNGQRVEGTTNAICREKGTGKLSFEGAESEVYFKKGALLDAGKICMMDAAAVAGVIGEHVGDCVALPNEELNEGIMMRIMQGICGDDMDCGDVVGHVKFLEDSTSYRRYPEENSTGLAYVETNTGDEAVKYLSKGKYGSSDALKVSPAEERILYQDYLKYYYKVDVDCGDSAVDRAYGDENGSYGEFYWFDADSKSLVTCYAKTAGEKVNDKLNGIVNGEYSYHSINGLRDLITLLKNNNYTDEDLAEMGVVSEDERLDEDIKDNCRNSDAGKNLGWILCPVLEFMGDLARGAYENNIRPMLEVKSYLFNGEQTAAYQAWTTFRDIANVLFAVILLIVVFSQVTGVGIDNYGIKRILPKLIVCIILINMSYLICALLIDASNIVGGGIQGLFEGLGSRLELNTFEINDPATIDGGGIALTAVEGAVGVSLLAGFAYMSGPIWAAAAGAAGLAVAPMVLISLLFAGLGVVISIMFVFFLLAARQAAIVVLVTISPIIILCDALPNTKSIFTRFTKMFQMLLLVFPTMALLMGGGNYVSQLILANDINQGKFYMALTAMVVGVIPIFFLPQLLKEAMAALPKVGQMLNGLGDKTKGVVSKYNNSLQNSDAAKESNKRWQYSNAKKVIDRLGKKGNLSERQLRQYYKHAGVAESYEKEQKAARLFAANAKYADRSINELENDFDRAFVLGDSENVDALAGVLTNRLGGSAAAKHIAGLLSAFGDGQEEDLQFKNNTNMQASVEALRKNLEQNTGLSKALQTKTSDAYEMIANGGKNNAGIYQNLGSFSSENHISDTNKPADWITQNRETLERAMLTNDGFKPEFAQRLLDANGDRNSSLYGSLSADAVKSLTAFSQGGGELEDARGRLNEYIAQREQDRPNQNQTMANFARSVINDGRSRFAPDRSRIN